MMPVFTGFLAGCVCLMAAIERPDRQKFWVTCAYLCSSLGFVFGLFGWSL